MASTLVLGEGGKDGSDIPQPSHTKNAQQKVRPSPPARATREGSNVQDARYYVPIRYPKLQKLLHNRALSFMLNSYCFKPIGEMIEHACSPVPQEHTMGWAIEQIASSWSQAMFNSQVVAMWLLNNVLQSWSITVATFISSQQLLSIPTEAPGMLDTSISSLLESSVFANAQHHSTFEISLTELTSTIPALPDNQSEMIHVIVDVNNPALILTVHQQLESSQTLLLPNGVTNTFTDHVDLERYLKNLIRSGRRSISKVMVIQVRRHPVKRST